LAWNASIKCDDPAGRRRRPSTSFGRWLAIFGWSDIRMAMRYTHAMEDAKRRAVEAIAVGSKRNAGETPAIPVSRDHSVTNEKPASDQIAVSG